MLVDTVEVTQEIFESFADVFHGFDAQFFYQFTSNDFLKDWEEFRMEQRHDEFWMNDWFQAKKHAFNSVLVVDLPAEQTGPRPEPHYNLISSKHIIAAPERNGSIEYFIFRHGEKTIAVYDQDAYTVYEQDGENLNLISQGLHDLGECPAKFITSKSFTPGSLVKASVFSPYLQKLNWLLFYAIGKRQFDLFGPFPIDWSYEKDCTYSDGDYYCSDGILINEEGPKKYGDDSIVKCPACSNRQFNGPGTHIEVREPEQGIDMRVPAGSIGRDVSNLEYVAEQVKELIKQVSRAITGNLFDPVQSQALNERQIQSLFEHRTKALLSFSEDLNKVRSWADGIACKLRYGSSYISNAISYGTDFYLFSAADLLDMYKAALEGNADSLTLDDLQKRYYSTKYRGNELEQANSVIRINLDPFRHKTDDQVLTMLDKGLITAEEAALKLNLSSLITRFERENGPVVEFGVALEFQKRIEIISQTLINYLSNGQQTGSTQADAQTQGDDPQPAGAEGG